MASVGTLSIVICIDTKPVYRCRRTPEWRALGEAIACENHAATRANAGSGFALQSWIRIAIAAMPRSAMSLANPEGCKTPAIPIGRNGSQLRLREMIANVHRQQRPIVPT